MDECPETDKIRLRCLACWDLAHRMASAWKNIISSLWIFLLFQDDGTMDQDVDGDGAINLSTSQRPSAATTPNDGVQTEDIEQVR